MELTVFERLLLLQALPKEGDLTTIRIVRTLREALSFSEEEIAEHKIETHPDGQVSWDNDAPKPITFGAKAREMVVRALDDISDAEKVTEAHLTLFDKFGVGLD